MSSHEPEPADDDTGPLHADRVREQSAGPGPGRFDTPLSVSPRPVQKDRRPVVLTVAATAAVVGLGVLAWAFWPSSDDSGTSGADATTTTESESPQEAEAWLLDMLPRGYAEGACEIVSPAKGALAQASCNQNTDSGGPLAATYTLARDDEALKESFDGVISTLSVVDCPGNIQSPGPWRRNATPQQTAGTLVCGFHQSKPMVAWTTEDDLLVSEVESGPLGPNMVQLYTWWASHS